MNLNELDEWWQDDYGKYQILKFFEDLDLLSDTRKRHSTSLEQSLTRRNSWILRDLTGNFIRAAKVLTEHKYIQNFMRGIPMILKLQMMQAMLRN